MATPTVYEMALSNAQAELQGIRTQFDALAKRKEHLESYIAATQALIGPQFSRPVFTIPASLAASVDADKAPLWKTIKFAINGHGNAFSIADAIAALERVGKPVQSPNKVQIVRNAIIKRTDTFRKLSPGTYAVIQNFQEESQEPAEAGS